KKAEHVPISPEPITSTRVCEKSFADLSTDAILALISKSCVFPAQTKSSTLQDRLRLRHHQHGISQITARLSYFLPEFILSNAKYCATCPSRVPHGGLLLSL